MIGTNVEAFGKFATMKPLFCLILSNIMNFIRNVHECKHFGTGYVGLVTILVIAIQLIIGGFVVLLMDDVINKWGFGSGISLFIVAGVAQQLVMRIFNPFNDTGSWALGLDIVNWQATGFFWSSISTAMSANWQGFFLAFLPM